MAIKVSAEILRRLPLFFGLDNDALNDFAKAGEEVAAKRGDVIFDSGEIADFIYVVVDGKVELRVPFGGKPDRRVGVSLLEEGELLGWPALVKPHIHELRAVAVEETTLVRFKGDQLGTLMVKHPAAGLKIMESVTEAIGSRLANMRFQFVNTVDGS